MEPQTQKQQITEILRGADNVVVTTSKDPDIDQTAGAIALAHIITKLGKRADAVVSGDWPSQVEFLGTKQLGKSFSGIRDFVISVDTSRTEADKLKYVPEGKRLNIYVTPYNGNYKDSDVSFHYGDYHTDAVVALGVADQRQLDEAIASQKELLGKSKLITINAGDAAPAGGGLNWHEPNASSVCELLMSLTEALQSGIVDDEIATALLTGIMAKTEHFTNAATTPKVMTMAAQLMAAGAKQPEILRHLQEVVPQKPGAKPLGKKGKKAKERGQLEPAQEEQLAHHAVPTMQNAAPKPAKTSQPKATIPQPITQPKPPTPKPPPPPPPLPPSPSVQPSAVPRPIQPAAPVTSPQPGSSGGKREMVVEPPSVHEPPSGHTETTVQPPRPASVNQVQPESRLGDSQQTMPGPAAPSIPPLSHSQPGSASLQGSAVTPPAPTADSPPEPPHVDIEAARKAVEEATKNTPAPPPPPPQQ